MKRLRTKLAAVAGAFIVSVAVLSFPMGRTAAADQAASTESRAAIILPIACDNLGYDDLPCFNPKSTTKAPQLTRLASQRARLTNFYTAPPTCTVSRTCLLTGRIPQRHDLDYQLPGVKGNYSSPRNGSKK
ncbi:MAG: hypothetical protein ACI9G1_003264 [Pirellulaceae bacterium]|jgi:hypothetical protein